MTTAGVGEWASPIDSLQITSKTLRLSSPSFVGDGILWLESRPSEGGRTVVVHWSAEAGCRDVTPAPDSGLDVRSRVHEYGGGAHAVTPDGHTLFFVNCKDQRVYRQGLQPGGSAPEPLTAAAASGEQRFADLTWDGAHCRLLAVRETHPPGGGCGGEGEGGGEGAGPQAAVCNTLVAVAADTGQVTTLAHGHDFFSNPCPSPDGTKLAWLTWDFPNMPWDSSQLHVGEVDPASGQLLPGTRVVAGGGEDSVQQPQWSPDGQRLLFISDRSGWWNLYAWGGHDQVECLCALEADFGWPQWLFGLRSYHQLDSHHILAAYNHPKEAGVSLGLINQVSHTVTPIHTGVTHFGSPTVLAALMAPGLPGHSLQVVSVVASPSTFPRVALMRLEGLQALAAAGPDDWHSLRSSAGMALDGGYLSVPQVMEFPSAGGRTAHMVYYPPANKDWSLPEGVLPPLVVHSHGGPTSAAVVSLSLHTQYWTSRGWALADVDYGGSTGYGREYRNRLRGTWGEVDVDDCCAAASWLAAEGKVDPGRMCISGGSAGGFTTLACLAFRDVFSAGCSLYGVADLALLSRDTHKFESRYLDLLVGPLPEAQALYAARSPLLHAQGFTRPIIFFQGEEDAVVPPEQARRMFEAVMQRRLPTALVLFKGEQHGFRQAAAIRAALDGELYFYSKVLGFPGSMPEGVEVPHIHNLPAGHNTA